MSVIPLGTGVSSAMETAYKDSLDAAVSVQDAVTAAQSEEVLSEEEAMEQLASKTVMGWQDAVQFFSGLSQKVSDTMGDLPASISVGITDLTDTAQDWIRLFLVGLAIILVSTIAIPVGILLLGLRAVRTLAGIPIPAPTLPSLRPQHHPNETDGDPRTPFRK